MFNIGPMIAGGVKRVMGEPIEPAAPAAPQVGMTTEQQLAARKASRQAAADAGQTGRFTITMAPGDYVPPGEIAARNQAALAAPAPAPAQAGGGGLIGGIAGSVAAAAKNAMASRTAPVGDNVGAMNIPAPKPMPALARNAQLGGVGAPGAQPIGPTDVRGFAPTEEGEGFGRGYMRSINRYAPQRRTPFRRSM